MVNDILEKLVSKVGQKLEILNLEEFGNALFIDNELQVAEKDEKLYSSTFVKSGMDMCKKERKCSCNWWWRWRCSKRVFTKKF